MAGSGEAEVKYVPRRWGLKRDPPTIVLEYAREVTLPPRVSAPGSPPRSPRRGKLYHHRIRLKTLTADTVRRANVHFGTRALQS